MADNTTLNTGTGGDVIASDDIGGIKFQRVKLIVGADGVNDGDISSVNPMPVRLNDAAGYLSNNTPLNEQTVAQSVRVIGAQFTGTTVDPNFWTSTVANSATITQSENEIILTSGVNAAGSAQLNTVRLARVIAGVSQQWRGGIQVSNTGIANNVRRWGIAWGATMPTITDGAFFKLNGTNFQVVTMKGGVETAVSSGAFNGTVSSYTMTTNAATYEIFYTQTAVKFVIGGVTIHTVSAAATPWTNQINCYCYHDNINSGNTTSVILDARFSVVRRFGIETSIPTYKTISTATTTICKYGPGSLRSIVVNNPTNNAITVYDNTAGSGTAIATINPGASATPFDLKYDCPFQIGLTIVTAGTPNLTVIYE